MSCIVKSSVPFLTVTFDGNGGTSTQNKITVMLGNTIGVLPSASKSYYTFDGWYTEGGQKVDANYVVTKNIILYAHYTAILYTVIYSTMYGTAPSSIQLPYGANVPLSMISDVDSGGKHYYQQGWIYNGSIVSSLIMPATNITLLASWHSYWNVTINANGGKHTNGSTGTVVYKINNGAQIGSHCTNGSKFMIGYIITGQDGVTAWEDTVVTSDLSATCNWKNVLTLYLKADTDISEMVSKVVTRCGSRNRYTYTNVTSSTAITCWDSSKVYIVCKESRTLAYKRSNSGSIISLGTGTTICFMPPEGATGVGKLPCRSRPDLSPKQYRILPHNDSTEPYNAEGWAVNITSIIIENVRDF